MFAFIHSFIHSFYHERNVRFAKLQQLTVPQTRTGSGKTAITITNVCTRYTCPRVSWAHSNRWTKTTLVRRVGRCSSYKRAVDNVASLNITRWRTSSHWSCRRTGVMCSCRPKPVMRRSTVIADGSRVPWRCSSTVHYINLVDYWWTHASVF